MKYVVALFVLSFLGFAYMRHRSRRDEMRVWTIGRRYALPSDEVQRFVFRLPLPSEAAAQTCARQVEFPGMTSGIERSPKGTSWLATWQIDMPADGRAYGRIVTMIGNAAIEVGVSDPMIIASASLEGSGTALLLETDFPHRSGDRAV
jgi:hypothetical protein